MPTVFSIRNGLQGELMDFLKSSGFESNGTTELVRDLTCSLASYREENVPLFPDVFLFPSVAVVTSISPGTQRVFLGNTSLTTGADNQRPYLITNQNEFNARFSPDGRWVAYASDETGRFELYIQSFPELSRGI